MFGNLELLAPAGKWDVLHNVIEAGADAVYLGGKRFNMRMLRPDYNFSNEELVRAVNYLHEKDKKLYITVNNIYNDDEINELKEYLLFLQDINVDALIVQDMGIVDICRELGINTNLHGSVQIGIGNSQAVNFLEQKGFSRVILSKNLSLDEISNISQRTNLGIEFFAHGDLCVSHTGQCYLSNFFFASSSNRGLCKKPCRWKYRLEKSNHIDSEFKYYLANNDLCLYPYLSELIKAGVCSFKIEGRMRSGDYLAYIINKYRNALDRLIDDYDSYQVDPDELEDLNLHRIRDYTTANLFSRPGLESINISGQREPVFPTAPVKSPPLKKEDYIKREITPASYIPELTVKIRNSDKFLELTNAGVNNFILGLDIMQQNSDNWLPGKVDELLNNARETNTKIFLETPRILTEDDISFLEPYLELTSIDRLNGIIANEFGSLNLVKNAKIDKIALWGGPGFNTGNIRAKQFFATCGFDRLTASLETDIDSLRIMAKSGIDMEVLVQGPLCGMMTDLCIPGSLNSLSRDKCSGVCRRDQFALVDEYEQKYKILSDIKCRNYIFYPYDLCLLLHIPELIEMGVKSLRIDGQYYDNEILLQVTRIYCQAIKAACQGRWGQEENYYKLLEMFPQGLTVAPLINKQKVN